MAERGFERFYTDEDQQEGSKKRGALSSEFFELPASIQKELVESPVSPLEAACDRLRKAGVSVEDLDLYRKSVRAYLEQGTEVVVMGASEYGGEMRYGVPMGFSKTSVNFGPQIAFSQGQSSLLPSSLLSEMPLRGRLTRDAQSFESLAISGPDALAHFRHEPDRTKTDATGEERFLVQLNRLAYALHEPLHVLQAPFSGDRLNVVMAEMECRDAVDAESARNILKLYDAHLHADSSNWTENPIEFPADENTAALENSVIGVPATLADKAWFSEKKKYGSSSRMSFLDNHYEATMDILSEDGLKSYLETKPALLLWMHNILSVSVSALREARSRLSAGEAVDEAVVARISAMIGPIAPMYFSVFRSSDEARGYLDDRQGEPAVLGRYLSGRVAECEAFTRLDIENTINDCLVTHDRAEKREKDAVEWTYPLSGQKHWASSRSTDRIPLTDEGARIAAKVAVSAAKKQWKFDDLAGLFKKIQTTLNGRGVNPYIRHLLQEQLELSLTEDEVKELYGVSDHFQVKLDSAYQRRLVLRKEIFHALESEAPEQTSPYLRAVFSSYDVRQSQLMTLLGFHTSWQSQPEPGVPLSQRKSVSRHQVTWEQIEADHRLGIFGLDVPALSPEQRAEMKEMYLRAEDPDKLPREDVSVFFKKLAEWKRHQKNQASRADVSGA